MTVRHRVKSRIGGWMVAASAVALAVPANAANYASVVGYGLNLQLPYGFSDYSSSSLLEADVSTRLYEGGELLWYRPGFGVDGPWGPPETPYPIEFRGEASANPLLGQLRARVDARTAPESDGSAPFRWAEAQAWSDGHIKLVGAGSVSTDVTVHFDGSFTELANYSVSLLVRSTTDPTRQWSVSVSGPDLPTAGDVDSRIAVSITGVAGESFYVWQSLWVSASTYDTFGGSFHSANFFNTSTLSFQPGSGTQVIGVDGYLAQVQGVSPVPEPATGLLLALGGSVLAWRLRRPA